MASFFNGLSAFLFGAHSEVAEAPNTAHSTNNEEQQPVPAQDVPEQATASVQTTTEPTQGPLTYSPSRAAEGSQGPPPSYRSAGYIRQLPDDNLETGRLPPGLTPLEQRCSVLLMHKSSLPEYRFKAQVDREKKRLTEKWAACHLKEEYWLEGRALKDMAREIVQRRWMEQGIWKEGVWFSGPLGPHGFWKHQEIREDDMPEDVRKVDCSRPFFQFMHDVSAERDHLEFLAYPPLLPADLITSPPVVDDEPTPEDVHTIAYYNVRYEQWVARGIWDYAWGALPGMFWKHELDIRVWFHEEFGSIEGIPPAHLAMSRSLPELQSFQRRRTAVLGSLPEAVERHLRRRQWAESPDAGQTTQDSPEMDYSPSPAPRRVAARPGPLTERPVGGPLFGAGPQHAAEVAGRSEVSLGRDQVETRQAVPEGRLFGETPEPRQGASTGDGVPRHVQSPPAAQQPQWTALFGPSEQMAPIPEEVAAAQSETSSAYGDENADEDPLDDIRRQFQDLQRSTQQVLDAHKALAAQLLAAAPRPSARRSSPPRGVFSGETHQRRVLGPLPSSQRVSKQRATGSNTVARSIESPATSSDATTAILRWTRSPSPAKHGVSVPAGSSHGATGSFVIREDSPRDAAGLAVVEDGPREQGFVVREDTHDDAEDVLMAEPRTEQSPRAQAKRRRRESAERRALQPLRRSKRRIGSR